MDEGQISADDEPLLPRQPFAVRDVYRRAALHRLAAAVSGGGSQTTGGPPAFRTHPLELFVAEAFFGFLDLHDFWACRSVSREFRKVFLFGVRFVAASQLALGRPVGINIAGSTSTSRVGSQSGSRSGSALPTPVASRSVSKLDREVDHGRRVDETAVHTELLSQQDQQKDHHAIVEKSPVLVPSSRASSSDEFESAASTSSGVDPPAAREDPVLSQRDASPPSPPRVAHQLLRDERKGLV